MALKLVQTEQPTDLADLELERAHRWLDTRANFSKWVATLTGSERRDLESVLGAFKARAPDPDLESDALDVLEFLNLRRCQVDPGKRGFKPVPANLRLIRARLREGATRGDLRAVVALKGRQVRAGEFSAKYYRPATLFNAEKFAQYCGELGSGGSANE